MRKAIYLGAAFAAVMTTSCSNDMDQFDATRGDGNVAIRLQLPDNFATRAFGDGQTATRLQYAVYHSGEKTVATTGTATFSDREAVLNLDLVNGMTYDFVFWADQPNNEFYAFDAASQAITVDYTGLEGNDENRDAFFGQLTGQEITGPTSLTATLKRPFAQINLGTSDFNEDAVKAAYPDFSSSMTISTTLPTTLNLLDGEVSGETTANVATTSEGRPTGETFPVSGFEYVSMNYILVDATKDVIDLTYSFKNNNAEVSNISVASVPVQRNYRTNIYGAVLTSPTDLMITIDPIFNEPDYNTKAVATSEAFISALADPQVEKIILTAPLDLTDMQAMEIKTPKVIDLSGVAVKESEYALTVGPKLLFEIVSSFTINGGKIAIGQGEQDKDEAVRMINVNRNGELNLNGVTIDGNLDHHSHQKPSGYNSAVITYYGNAKINIADSKIKGGMYVIFAGNASEEATVTCTNSYFESNSSSLNSGGSGTYAINAKGNVLFKDCTVVGVEGAIYADAQWNAASVTKVAIDGGTYYSYNSTSDNTDGNYAVRVSDKAIVTINGGYFYGANKRNELAGENGTSAVVSDANATDNIIINGGYFSGMPYNHVTNTTYEPATGWNFKEIEETVDGRKYIWTVEAAE